MERTKRVIKAPVRLIAQDEPVNNELNQAKSKKQAPKKQAPKQAKVPRIKTTTKLPSAPEKSTKTKSKTKARTLDLVLPDIPSDDRKFRLDWSYYDNPFWLNNFYTPKDNTTQEYMEVTEKLNNILPANFVLVRGQDQSFGVANLELNPDLVKPIKRIPLYSKLEKGEYEIASSKSDKTNIAGSIKFFRNNLASFVQYKTTDDISWVVRHHRQLVTEILEHYANGEAPKVSTIKSRFNAITRIFRIAYETKNYELYEKYSSLVIFLSHQFEADEFDNELSELELTKFVSFDIVLNKQAELQKQFELIQTKKSIIGYDLNQNLLLVSLYSLIPPLRLEIMSLKFDKKCHREDDWIIIKPDEVLMDLNEIKKKHLPITFNITNDAPELAKILKESYELYPREFLFTHFKKYPDVSTQVSPATLSERLNKLFSFTGKTVGINALRSSYVSYQNSEAIKNGKQLTVNQKEKIAQKMRTSRKYLDESYLKIFPNAPLDVRPEVPNVIVVHPVNEKLPTEKQYDRTKKYYQENKEKVLAQQKEYKDKKTPYEKSRIKMLYYLNSDPDYHTKMKQATQTKYSFKKEGNKWI